jgi:hypothetical protein
MHYSGKGKFFDYYCNQMHPLDNLMKESDSYANWMQLMIIFGNGMLQDPANIVRSMRIVARLRMY